LSGQRASRSGAIFVRTVTPAILLVVTALDPFEWPSPERLKIRLGISQEAADLFFHSDVIDLHVESYSFYRSFGYHPHRRHTGGLHRALVVGQADIPRILETGINGATWVITANPLRPAQDRALSFARHMAELKSLLNEADGHLRIVTNLSQYRQAVAAKKHACFLGVQGANALPPDPEALDAYARDLFRITLVHLTNTSWGSTSAPSLLRGDRGLSALGYSFIEKMNDLRIGVDLAHVHEQGFWDAVHASSRSLPLLVTHTGVRGAHNHWRNLSDAQLKAIASTGGTVGIMFHSVYLGDGLFSGKLSSVVRHIKHALSIVGPEHVSLGSDWDGAICTPRDMPTCSELPLLVQALLDERVEPDTIRNILGLNFLRVLENLKGSDA